jgi:hypothetical protein
MLSEVCYLKGNSNSQSLFNKCWLALIVQQKQVN